MNKIERAIYDCNLEIAKLERERLTVTAELYTLNKQLQTLESIKNDKSIPHESIDKIPNSNLPKTNKNGNKTTNHESTVG